MARSGNQFLQKDLVWLGCALDCEGSFIISKTTDKRDGKLRYNGYIAFANSNKEIIVTFEKIMTALGIKFARETRRAGANKRTKSAFLVRIWRSRELATLTQKLPPFLIGKKNQCRLLFSFCRLKTMRLKTRKWKLNEKNKEEIFYREMKRLNRL